MDQPKVERMLRLMTLLSGNVQYTIDELMEKLGMSRRTIYRYLDTFKDAGFAVQKVGTGGNVYKMATLKNPYADLSKVVHFSEEEAYIVNRLIDNLDNTNQIKQGLRRKLASIYDATSIASFIDKKENSANIEALSKAIKNGKVVILHNYSSTHSTAAKDYRVEPYMLNANYIDIWAYDQADGVNKRFKTARIGEVELLDEDWTNEEKHEASPVDIFHTHGVEPTHIKLRMTMLAKNLMVEEFPLSEKSFSADGDGYWIWEGDVRRMEGVGRFVLGLPKFIQILEGDSLREWVRENAAYTLENI